MNYFIAVELKPTHHPLEVSKALQKAFDGGASGRFKILGCTPTCMVVFQRDRDADEEYLSARVKLGGCLQTAAMRQLADELVEGDIGPKAAPIVEILRKGSAYCFDFDGFF